MTDNKQPDKTEPAATPWQPWWRKFSIAMWDKRLLIPSLIVGAAVYAWCAYQIKIHTPPEGYVFEQLEPLTGVYKCCGSGGRSSQSWVDEIPIRCVTPKYYGGESYLGCHFKQELNGKVVTVKQIWYETNFGKAPAVRELSSDGRIYIHESDSEIRRQWISASEGGAQSNALGAFLLTYLIVLFIYDRKLKNQGDKK